jgi:hypothetical protein
MRDRRASLPSANGVQHKGQVALKEGCADLSLQVLDVELFKLNQHSDKGSTYILTHAC